MAIVIQTVFGKKKPSIFVRYIFRNCTATACCWSHDIFSALVSFYL